MGYMRHHAFVVSASYGGYLDDAHAKAVALNMAVSGIVKSPLNGVRSFVVAPDGSPEDWVDSDTGDSQREAFKAWLDRQRYEDESGPLAWVEIQYGDEERQTLIIAHSDQEIRFQPGILA